MKISKLLLLGMLIVALTVPAMAATPTFTGDVPADFPIAGPGILTINDPIGDVGVPAGIPGPTGWEFADLRLTYDSTTDTMYVGMNAASILGDADGDGSPGGTSAWLDGLGGTDAADLGGSETAAVYFDLNQDGTFDVIAGIGNGVTVAGFSVSVFSGAFDPPNNFGAALPGNTGTHSGSPSVASPDFEFTITNWSTLPGQDAIVGFRVGASLGSQLDDGIGEDFMIYEQSPSTDVGISASAIDAGTVDLTVTEHNDGGIPLTDVEVVVNDGTTDITTLDATTALESITDDNILEDGETWTWNATTNPGPSNSLNDVAVGTGKTWTATGSGTDPAGFVVTIPGDPDEEASVTVTPLPEIDVEKTVDCEVSKEGDEVNYTITIRNIGPVTVTPTVVDDTVLGNLLSAFIAECGDLEPAEFCTLQFGPYIMPAGPDPHINTVTFEAEATANPSDTAGPVTDDATVDLVHPEFTVNKSCRAEPLEVGDTAVFDILVENTGDVCLHFELTELGEPVGFNLPAGEFMAWETSIEVLTQEDIENTIIGTVTLRAGDPPGDCGAASDCLPNSYQVNASDTCSVGTGATRTWGYWKTHYYMAEYVFNDCYPDGIDFGWTYVDNIQELMAIFHASKAKLNKLCQSRLQDSRQYGAAILNDCIGLDFESSTGLTKAGVAATMAGCDRKAIQAQAGIIGGYNESGDGAELVLPLGLVAYNATPKYAKQMAGDIFPDTLETPCEGCINGAAVSSKGGKGPK